MSSKLNQKERRSAKAEVPGADPGGDTTGAVGERSRRNLVTVESAGSNPASVASAAQAQADVLLSCKQVDAGSRPASGSSGWGVPRPRGRTHSSLGRATRSNV